MKLSVQKKKAAGLLKSMTATKKLAIAEKKRQQNNPIFALYRAIVTSPDELKKDMAEAVKVIRVKQQATV